MIGVFSIPEDGDVEVNLTAYTIWIGERSEFGKVHHFLWDKLKELGGLFVRIRNPHSTCTEITKVLYYEKTVEKLKCPMIRLIRDE